MSLGFTIVFTEAPRYEPRGAEHFPAGAHLKVLCDDRVRALVPDFAASADPDVSFDGKRILFAGKQKPNEPWQVWEVPISGGVARRMTSGPEDCIRPLYVPDDKIAYARRTAGGFRIEVSGTRLTFAPGDHIPCAVLRDGRILFEAPHPFGASDARDLYTVYTDGSGIEAHRCDHGRDRQAGRELVSGDIVFQNGTRLAMFTPALAGQVELRLPPGEFAGPVAEVGPGEWVVAYRKNARAALSLHSWNGRSLERLTATGAGNAVQPAIVAPRPVPKRHPSALHDWVGANLLCLNAYVSRDTFAEGSIASVRVYAQADGAPVLLGETKVERDGSFFVHIPAERPVRIELRDGSGRTIKAEQGWFWMRRGEQRVCVGCHAGPERAPENAVPEVLLRSDVPVKMPAGGK